MITKSLWNILKIIDMKRTRTDTLIIALLFIAIIVTIFLAVYFCVVNYLHIAFKIIIFILATVLSIVEFLTIENVNKKYFSKRCEKNEDSDNKFSKKENQYFIGHSKCPKCYHPYDGIICFHCGYKKTE